MWTNIPEHNLFCFYYVLCFIVHHYGITISKQNLKINTIIIKWNKGWKEGALSCWLEDWCYLMITLLLICNQRSQNLQMFWSHPISKIIVFLDPYKKLIIAWEHNPIYPSITYPWLLHCWMISFILQLCCFFTLKWYCGIKGVHSPLPPCFSLYCEPEPCQ